MKALNKNSYTAYRVSTVFNRIILDAIQSYNGTKKEQLKSFLEDVQQGGCISGMIGEFIYHSDCKEFYIAHIDDLEDIREQIEDAFGEPVKNPNRLPHYTFMCWLCFEQYCYEIYSNSFE